MFSVLGSSLQPDKCSLTPHISSARLLCGDSAAWCSGLRLKLSRGCAMSSGFEPGPSLRFLDPLTRNPQLPGSWDYAAGGYRVQPEDYDGNPFDGFLPGRPDANEPTYRSPHSKSGTCCGTSDGCRGMGGGGSGRYDG